ncbi:hypothetical protein UlMin_044864 [Ulmus minor]
MLKICSLFFLFIVFNNLHCLAKGWSSAMDSYCFPMYGEVAKNFSIHGLWPNDMSGASIWNCDPKNQFNERKVSMLVSDMQAFWPSITCPSTNSRPSWSHEWSKHGTCSGLIQFNYFDGTLKLKNRANILKALKNAGAIGFSPIIMCKNGLLKEVYICVDSSASTFIACPPKAASSNCLSTIKFPPYPNYPN